MARAPLTFCDSRLGWKNGQCHVAAQVTVRGTYRDLYPEAAGLVPAWFATPADLAALPAPLVTHNQAQTYAQAHALPPALPLKQEVKVEVKKELKRE